MGFGAGMDFYIFNTLFRVIFLLIVGVFIFTIIKGISEWNRNNNSPRLTIMATVVSKRTHVSRHYQENGICHTTTKYYVTFQVESGDRMELRLSGSEYGMLAEGDKGLLSFQGTRYLDFERQKDMHE